MPDEKKPDPKKDAEQATYQTSEGTEHSKGTAADALPSKESVDKGVREGQEAAEGHRLR